MPKLTREDYMDRHLKEEKRILEEEQQGIGDKDIHNLELILYSIMPRSYWFKRGCISSLRKAIAALEKEKRIARMSFWHVTWDKEFLRYIHKCPECGAEYHHGRPDLILDSCPTCGIDILGEIRVSTKFKQIIRYIHKEKENADN